MADDATRRTRPSPPVLAASIGLAGAAVGVFSTWASDGPVTLNGTQGPNNGWFALIVGAFALCWLPSLVRGSWFAVVAMLGAAVAMAWTALENWLDNRDVLGAGAGYGLLLVVAASVALACSALLRGADLSRRRRADVPGQE